uniref:helix-turn-helix domain-containing protein n=1 Tax=Mycoplasmopsis anatis TaxID=171279 RepID=UPI0038CD8F0C
MKEIGKMLKRSVSTISREIKRNSNIYGCYDASYAHKKWELDNVLFKKSQCVFRHKAFNDFFVKNYKKIITGLKQLLNFIKKKLIKKVIL